MSRQRDPKRVARVVKHEGVGVEIFDWTLWQILIWGRRIDWLELPGLPRKVMGEAAVNYLPSACVSPLKLVHIAVHLLFLG